MKKLVIFSLLISISLPSLFATNNNVLVIDYNNAFSSDQSWNGSLVYNRLVATNTSVTRINAIPAVINLAYDECWIFGNMGNTATNITRVSNYINAGRAVYIQSEVSCCNTQAAFVDALINAVTIVGGAITHVVNKSSWYQFDAHPDLICSPWPNSYGAACRPFVGTPNANILFEANNTCGNAIGTGDVVGVRFGSCDMISGQGALLANGDFNIFPSGGTCNTTGILSTPNSAAVIDLIDDLMDSLLVCGVSGCPILPIELLTFDGYNKNNVNEFYWSTSSEINNDYFTLERSWDAIHFEEIATINGAGNSNVLLEYEETDLHPMNGTNYYRLRQTDFDGNYSFSKMITLSNKLEHSLSVYPNPSTSFITLFNKENSLLNSIVKVYDIQGRIVLEELISEDNPEHQINISTFNNGLYFIKINSGENSFKGSFIKE